MIGLLLLPYILVVMHLEFLCISGIQVPSTVSSCRPINPPNLKQLMEEYTSICTGALLVIVTFGRFKWWSVCLWFTDTIVSKCGQIFREKL